MDAPRRPNSHARRRFGYDTARTLLYQAAMSNARITKLEEEVAHLTRVVEELSDVIARQDTALSRLSHRVQMLMEREAEREMDAGGSVPLADQKPPHW